MHLVCHCFDRAVDDLVVGGVVEMCLVVVQRGEAIAVHLIFFVSVLLCG